MKKYLLLIVMMQLLIVSCNFPASQTIEFNEQVATKAAFAMTATFISNKQFESTITPNAISPTFEMATQTPAATISIDNLGEPDWEDDFSTPANWFKSGSSAIYGNSVFLIKNGAFIFETSALEGMIWHLNYQKTRDFYLEADFNLVNCAGNDQFGLVLRATNYSDGFAYYALFTCDGKFNLLTNTTLGLVASSSEWKKISDFVNYSGANIQMGVWLQDSTIRLFANQVLLQEYTDTSHPEQGHFGFAINPRQTPAFQVKADNIALWHL